MGNLLNCKLAVLGVGAYLTVSSMYLGWESLLNCKLAVLGVGDYLAVSLLYLGCGGGLT